MDIRPYDLSIKIDTKIDTSEKKIDTNRKNRHNFLRNYRSN